MVRQAQERHRAAARNHLPAGNPLVDTDASNKSADADAALRELGSDQVAFGYVTTTVTVLDADPAQADEKLRMVEQVIPGRGFVTIPRP